MSVLSQKGKGGLDIKNVIFYIILFVLGSIIGSFLNCLAWRLKNNKKFILERSLCPACGRQLAWYENIPILSFLFLAGRCKTCQVKIPLYYFLTEFFTGALFVFVGWFNYNSFYFSLYNLIFELFIASVLVFIFLYDALYKEILSGVIWATTSIVFIRLLFLDKPDYLSIFYGILFGFGFFALQYIFSKGRWIGGGDVRFGVLIGALLGISKTVIALLIAYWLGALVGISLIIMKKRKMGSEIPFGTFLVVGTLVAMYYGDYIIRWYMNFIK